jgi:hypothetical protein
MAPDTAETRLRKAGCRLFMDWDDRCSCPGPDSFSSRVNGEDKMTDVALVGSSKSSRGPWSPARKVRSVAIFGATEVDFRQAQLPEGVTEVALYSLFGTNSLIVPSDMPVTVTGLSLFGSRTMRRLQAKQMPPPTARSLRVSGMCILGRLSVKDLP